jgi:hypothetical protein
MGPSGGNAVGATLYERLGVARDVDGVALRAAYRHRARLLHPDLAGAGADPAAMAELNEAWHVLSDPERRRAYDASLPHGAGTTAPAAPGRRPTTRTGAGPTFTTTAPPTRPERSSSPGWRREAWLVGLQLQIRRLGTQAARSAVQTLVVRHVGAPREDYEQLIEPIVAQLLVDTDVRVREARAAGAVPFDLANGAALIGLRVQAARLEAESRATGPRPALLRAAEMVDRMWDTMAHEIPRPLEHALGDNPKATRRVR